MIKVYTPINANSSLLARSVRISERKIASYLKKTWPFICELPILGPELQLVRA